MRLFAVIATHNRHELVRDLTIRLSHDEVLPVLVDNASTPPVTDFQGVKLTDPEQPPNLSRLWNLGLAEACRLSADSEEFAIAVLNDDLRIYPGFVRELADGLGTEAAATHPAGFVGCAYVLRGSLVRTGRLRFDERFRWWYGDNDLEWQARKLGGLRTVELRGVLQHLYPNASTKARPELREQAERDRQAFVEKWGKRPESVNLLAPCTE
jgi:GT2 family glycosyltransferase